ncbi:DUF4030 domain-containing protein [Sporosarcina cascadiensis]|uniref:DUF4030 domain-containing protein n=1 Tax=Sporosarcina cascadiensis TaxID=2660747 RepID=UPI00129BB410|nr:DUF4030 domain-containing protein [Sporosarcina cascadiensis]
MKDSLDEQLHHLQEELRITEESKRQLQNKIMHSIHSRKQHKSRPYLWAAAAICLAIIFMSPFYSTTMAGLAAKISPISITPGIADSDDNSGLTSQLYQLVEGEGYEVNSVGVLPSPDTIEISLVLNEFSLQYAKQQLEPKIMNFLSDNGYDSYEIKILKANEKFLPDRADKTNDLYDQVREIVKEIFTSYGYAEETEYELAGLKTSLFSNVVTLDMPDHIKEKNKIVASIEKELKTQKLKVKKIEVNSFNLEHRQQDNRWAYMVSDINEALAGKSVYKLAGISYMVREGRSYVTIKTELDSRTSDEILEEIERAIREYLSLPDIQEIILNDKYAIQLVNSDEELLVEIKN